MTSDGDADRFEDTTIEEFIEAKFDAPASVDEEIEVRRTKQSARIRLNIKRGTGTRDHEEVTVEVTASSLYDLAPQVEPMRELAFAQMRSTRSFQPGMEGDDGA